MQSWPVPGTRAVRAPCRVPGHPCPVLPCPCPRGRCLTHLPAAPALPIPETCTWTQHRRLFCVTWTWKGAHKPLAVFGNIAVNSRCKREAAASTPQALRPLVPQLCRPATRRCRRSHRGQGPAAWQRDSATRSILSRELISPCCSGQKSQPKTTFLKTCSSAKADSILAPVSEDRRRKHLSKASERHLLQTRQRGWNISGRDLLSNPACQDHIPLLF